MDFALSNSRLRAEWSLVERRLAPRGVTGVDHAERVHPNACHFALEAGPEVLQSSDLVLNGQPELSNRKGDAAAARIADREDAETLTVPFVHPQLGLHVEWRASLGRTAHYLVQTLALSVSSAPIALSRVVFFGGLPDATEAGTVRGSPLVAGRAFAAVTHPMAENRLGPEGASCSLPIRLPLRPGAPITVSAVLGFARPGQYRRDFAQYIECERPRPYGPLLHYNSWYDLGFFTPFDEAAALGAIESYGEELVRKRGVRVDGFLLDDGWDDPRTLWSFHEGFPNGFARVREAAQAIGASPGVWLSPWGGYSTPKQRRMEFARQQGFEMNEHGLALSGPVYYQRFLEVCSRFVTEYGVNHFKFDGTGDTGMVVPESRFGSDFDAAIELIRELRRLRGDLYVNLTTGTWASPFWLLHADSIWRGGEDYGFEGPGTKRQQWITYRDAATYRNVVRPGPLFPLNSLMLHGVTFAPHAPGLEDDPGNDLPSEIWSLFASGTQLQELYVSPRLMTPERWDVLAKAASWARSRADVLQDTHWVGGDPGELEPYGWASWTRTRQVVCVRNPADVAQRFTLCPRRIWEPPVAEAKYRFERVWGSHPCSESFELTADGERSLSLEPFEVVVLEATALPPTGGSFYDR